MLAGQPGGNAEPGEPGAAACHVHQDIRRLDVFMDKTSLMHSAERTRERDRDVQEFRYVQSSVEQSIERLPAGVLKHQRQPVVVAGQRDWPRRPGSIKFDFERILMLEPFERTGRGVFCDDKQDWRQAIAGAPVEG